MSERKSSWPLAPFPTMFLGLAMGVLLGLLFNIAAEVPQTEITHVTKIVKSSNSILATWEWIKDDGTSCGTVNHWMDRVSLPWEAYAYDDYSRSHYYATQAEAERFISKWCKP